MKLSLFLALVTISLFFFSVYSLPHQRDETEDQIRIGKIISEKLSHLYENKTSFSEKNKPEQFSSLDETSNIRGLNPDTVRKIEKEIGTFLDCTGANGLSIGITNRDGSVYYTKGFRSRSSDGKPVDTETVFPIASLTKAFTGFLVAQLEEENRLNVTGETYDSMLGLKLGTKNESKRITTKDLLTHFTGYPGQVYDIALTATETPFTPEHFLNKVRDIGPKEPAREEFIYSNIIFSLAGYIAAQVGMNDYSKWHQLVESNILNPLNMNRTFTNVTDLERYTENWAKPMTLNGTELPLDSAKWTRSVAPSASMASTPKDMLKWIQLFLNDGSGIIKPESIHKMTSPAVPVPSEECKMKTDQGYTFCHIRKGYGYGWYTGFWEQLDLIHHSGSIEGSEAQLTISNSSSHPYGVVSMSNKDRTSSAMMVLHIIILDLLRGESSSLPSDRMCQEYPSPKRTPAVYESKNPTRSIESYVGEFCQVFMGNISISLIGENTLQMNYGKHLQGILYSQGNDYFTVGDIEWKINDEFTLPYGEIFSIKFDSDINWNDQEIKTLSSNFGAKGIDSIVFSKSRCDSSNENESSNKLVPDRMKLPVSVFHISKILSNDISKDTLVGTIVGSFIGASVTSVLGGIIAIGVLNCHRR